MARDREYDEKMGLSRAGRDATDSYSESKLRRNATGDSPSEIKLRQNAKPRKKSSDTSKMNPVYKPKASPGPAMNTLNLYGASKSQTLNMYGSPSPRTKPQSLNMYGAPTLNAKPKKKSNFTYSAPKAGKSKSKAKDTSFKKSGVAGVLKSPEAKKFRDTFRKKGLLPALRGK